jgi:predicted RNase H-like HicB family nuclease
MAEPETYTVRIHSEPGQDLWAELVELPGVLAAGTDMAELRESLTEAISLYLSKPGAERRVELDDKPGAVTEQHVLVRTA